MDIREAFKTLDCWMPDMVYREPYASDRGYFECRDCVTRTTSQSRIASCPDCGGEVRNLAVGRE